MGGGISAITVLIVLINITVLTFYELFIYRYTTHKALYSKSFSISICILPYLLGTIIMALQSNYYLALGTIGALAIIRFRSAIKDPVDMIYLLWAIHTGIMCGCQLYAISYIVAVIMTIVITIMEKFSENKQQYILTIHLNDFDDTVLEQINKLGKKVEIKNRSKNNDGFDLVIEFRCKDINIFEKEINKLNITKYSIIECTNGDIFW